MGSVYEGIGGVRREMTKCPVGIGGVTREVTEIYAGVGGVRRLVWQKPSPGREIYSGMRIEFTYEYSLYQADYIVHVLYYAELYSFDGEYMLFWDDAFDGMVYEALNYGGYFYDPSADVFLYVVGESGGQYECEVYKILD